MNLEQLLKIRHNLVAKIDMFLWPQLVELEKYHFKRFHVCLLSVQKF